MFKKRRRFIFERVRTIFRTTKVTLPTVRDNITPTKKQQQPSFS